jgi:signal peptidase I
MKRRRRSGAVFELVLIAVLVAAFALLIQAFFVKSYHVPSAAMEPTLRPGEHVLANRMEIRFSNPHLNDVIVFHPPAGSERDRCGVAPIAGRMCPQPTRERSENTAVKRVVGVPGERIAMVGGHVIRNGRRTVEKFIRACARRAKCTYRRPVLVPRSEYFVLGDNRAAEDDSRAWGPVKEDWIIGTAFAVYWPPGQIRLL